MFIPINTFNDIKLTNPNTLVICDIDDTLVYWDKKKEDYYEMVQNDFPEFSQEEIDKEALDFLNIYKTIFPPKITDPNGFSNLKEKIKLLPSSKMIFLTARTSDLKNDNKFTRKNFETIGLDYNDWEVHYTNNRISKGEYIKKNINLEGYDEIIFIDDYESYIKHVKDIFPHINCYKFEILN